MLANFLWLWALVLLAIFGVIVGNIRSIALPTLRIPEDERVKANCLVGMVSGIGFLVTSAVSGFLVAGAGMELTLIVCLAATLIGLIGLIDIRMVPFMKPPQAAPSDTAKSVEHLSVSKIDLRGTVKVVAGLFALILFAMFNNFLGGIFMALLGAYGLSL